MIYLQLLGGFVLLLGGAEFLVRGAVQLAARLGISPLIIGLTVVAYCTTMPELLVSMEAAFRGAPGIAIGNIVGSNICNLFLILGAAACVCPLVVEPREVRFEGWAVIGVTLLFLALALSGKLGLFDGALLLACLACFTAASYRRARRGQGAPEAEQTVPHKPLWMALGTLAIGLGCVIGGANLLVEGAISLARVIGVSEAVIGVTVVAVGTSLPELATAIVSAYRRHPEVAVGNVLGANVFNLLAIGGVVAMVHPIDIPGRLLDLAIWVMLAATIVLVSWLMVRGRFGRPAGLLFLAVYAAYVVAEYAPPAGAG
ncbi:MAG: calcium/sodium antiporter [Alphaproteobacteria bacterium]|nr:calcium/sodium antiporter [Alphaproteobacteria bacterium]MCY4319746.1 calcium/sodium antiporter [Alphaproteobacteria bacterium]